MEASWTLLLQKYVCNDHSHFYISFFVDNVMLSSADVRPGSGSQCEYCSACQNVWVCPQARLKRWVLIDRRQPVQRSNRRLAVFKGFRKILNETRSCQNLWFRLVFSGDWIRLNLNALCIVLLFPRAETIS